MNDFSSAARHIHRHHFGMFARRCFDTLEPGRTFHDNWHIPHICLKLSEVAAGRIRRLNINVPPRSLKSILVSVALPAWLLGRDPGMRIMCVSYSEDLAKTFAVQTRLIMQQPWYQRTFPECQLTSRRPRDTDLRTTRNGSRYAVGIGGAITGRGADIIICDEPIKAQDALSIAARQRVIDYVDSTLWTRLNDRRRSAFVLTMQRLHEDDLAGHLIRRGGWTTIALPAIATEDRTFQLSRDPQNVHHRRAGDFLQPEREGQTELDEQRRNLGMYNFAAQYQQDPIPAIGHVVRREWLRYYDERPAHFDRTLISWDTASSVDERSDYSAGTVWGRCGDDMYLLEVIRGRYEVPALQRLMIEVAQDYTADVFLIEDDGVGRGIVQNLRDRRLTRPLPRLNRPNTDKVARLLRHLPLIEDGRLHLPTDAPWLANYEAELLGFPVGRHDDQVDSTTQALDYLVQDAARSSPGVRRDVQRRDVVRRTIVSPAR